MSGANKKIKIKSKLFIEGKIHTLTGLHIGGSSSGLKVGGVDGAVVRSALENQPYIPGSSLRGKMRSLLERARGPESESLKEGGYSENGQAGTNGETLLGRLFGVSAGKKDKENNEPSRLIVRDSCLTNESAKALESASNTDMPMTEVKTEVNIDRVTSQANPRDFERVPAGAVFKADMILTLFEKADSAENSAGEADKGEDDHKKFLDLIFEAFDLIEGDSLGGHGSRGYGKVCFREFKIRQKSAEDYKKGKPCDDFGGYEIPPRFKEKLEKREKEAEQKQAG